MSSELFVGNLAFSITDETLKAIFSEAGTVQLAKVITDRSTGKSRGFGFVTMDSAESAAKAIEKLNNYDAGGRSLRVNFSNSDGQSSGSRPRSGSGGGFRNNDGGSRSNDGGSGSFNRRPSQSYGRS